jgi:hypothetical protein
MLKLNAKSRQNFRDVFFWKYRKSVRQRRWAYRKAFSGRTGVSILAIHLHMTGESSRSIILHYWGSSKTEAIAISVNEATNIGETAQFG